MLQLHFPFRTNNKLLDTMGKQHKLHRERSQPHSRHKFGLLEKKSDYKLRAKNFHAKENAIKQLEKKALTRNPDEFYFKMVNIKQNSKGKIIASDYNLSPEMIKLMKTQDRQYIVMLIEREISQIEKLKNKMNVPYKGVHIIYCSTEANTMAGDADSSKSPAEIELEQREERLSDLKHVLGQMTLQYHLSHSKGPRKKIEHDDGSVTYKWKAQRAK
eukprot:NODE_700_length_4628_cov_1.474718.p3 type:complete len:216 gc:universal NODE_700_length_4628_cov_1.474718:2235-1588(-)